MSSLSRREPSEIAPLLGWAAVALVVELLIFSVLGGKLTAEIHNHEAPPSSYLDAEVVAPPPIPSHLVDRAKQIPKVAAPREKAVSREAGKGLAPKPGEKAPEENQTRNAPALPPTHGPVALFAPSPKIPAYLQDQDLHANVVIDFFVAADGSSAPHLVGTSGNEELDAIALKTARLWRFRPGEKDQKAVDEKVRLRIVFDVQ